MGVIIQMVYENGENAPCLLGGRVCQLNQIINEIV